VRPLFMVAQEVGLLPKPDDHRGRKAPQKGGIKMDHKIKRIPGVPGVYDIIRCSKCGYSARVSPRGVTFGVYLPLGNIDFPKCTGALDEDVPEDFFPAYQKLLELYKKHNALRDFITPSPPGGFWPRIAIGNWGLPKIELWEGWFIDADITLFSAVVALFQTIISEHKKAVSPTYLVAVYKTLPEGCGCGTKPCEPRVLLSPSGEPTFIRPHGSPYPDQSITPKPLEGWEQFRELAMLMYKLPVPAEPQKVWFGRSWGGEKHND